ncbi:MAG: extracellular solute-binding protein [Treponema sp.]|jgi:iron(III) transport system substrate-binding protein|nr:extracellular solute-binding protein [Treponema sp.]
MKKFIGCMMLLGICLLSGCSGKKEQVVFYLSSEDFRIEHFQNRVNEQFPDYQIIFNYLPTGNLAAKLAAEGAKTECDIIGELDTAYLEGLLDNLADLSSYDDSVFLDSLVPAHHKYLPMTKSSGCIFYSEEFLAARNLPVPASYDDLLKPEYKGLISMPNPKSSSTGFFFLRNLINTRGEDAAFAYFDKLSENILQFTSSGSGPVNALVQGEAGIGLGMTFQVVTTINQGVPLNILFFEEGSPYSVYGLALIKGKETRKAVQDVFEFFLTKVVYEDKDLFMPEQIFKVQPNTIPNYPQNVLAADMTGIENLAEKQRVLEKWKY